MSFGGSGGVAAAATSTFITLGLCSKLCRHFPAPSLPGGRLQVCWRVGRRRRRRNIHRQREGALPGRIMRCNAGAVGAAGQQLPQRARRALALWKVTEMHINLPAGQSAASQSLPPVNSGVWASLC